MKELRIAIIDPVGKKAGLDHYDLSLALALNRQFCFVKVYSNFSDDNNSSIVFEKFDVNFTKPFILLVKLFPAFYSSLKNAKTDKTEIIILHIFHSTFIDWLMIFLTRRFGFKICLIVHDAESFIYKKRKSWINKCMLLSDNVVIHNKFTYDALYKRSNVDNQNKLSVIPHGNFINLHKQLERDDALIVFNLDKSFKYILFFGMIKKSKGLEIVIEAMKQVSENVHLIIAGRIRDADFSEYISLADKINVTNRLHIMNRYISNEERNTLLNISDTVILPYHSAWQSGVMIMAMSYGIPVIASDLKPNKEVIENGKNGFLFSSGNPSELAEKINFVTSDNEMRDKVGKTGLQYIKVNNDWDKIGEKFINLFK